MGALAIAPREDPDGAARRIDAGPEFECEEGDSESDAHSSRRRR